VFWLAAAATLNDLFSKRLDETGTIPRELSDQVTTIYNSHYYHDEEFLQNDLYLVAFLLDPRGFLNFTSHLHVS
jgi:hypothetical protein